MATSSNPRFTIDQQQRLDQDIADIEEKLHSITRLVRVYYDADSPAAMVVAQPLNKNEFVAIRLMTAWMNSRCFSLASILPAPIS